MISVALVSIESALNGTKDESVDIMMGKTAVRTVLCLNADMQRQNDSLVCFVQRKGKRNTNSYSVADWFIHFI